MSYIQIDDVDLHYQARNPVPETAVQRWRWRTLKLSIERDEFVGIVGPSGCGKSTLLKLISGLIRPSRGVVRVAGEEVKKPLKNVGMAFQNSTLLPWRDVRGNVLLPLEIVEPYRSQPRSQMAAKRQHADDLLASVGLSGFGNRMPWQLSGGMQQRAQLCRALIRRAVHPAAGRAVRRARRVHARRAVGGAAGPVDAPQMHGDPGDA